MNHLNSSPTSVEDRAATLLASRLDIGLQSLGPDISERLRFARKKALSRARQTRLQAKVQGAASPEMAWAGRLTLAGAGTASESGDLFGGWAASMVSGNGTGPSSSTWWSKLVSALPLLILLMGFLAIQDTLTERQIQAAAEVDAALLADALPPQAYSDPGFAEFLRRHER
jgi:hypothetical protein